MPVGGLAAPYSSFLCCQDPARCSVLNRVWSELSVKAWRVTENVQVFSSVVLQERRLERTEGFVIQAVNEESATLGPSSTNCRW